jgi:hypothetical protein
MVDPGTDLVWRAVVVGEGLVRVGGVVVGFGVGVYVGGGEAGYGVDEAVFGVDGDGVGPGDGEGGGDGDFGFGA